jgi:hypothetical protein
MHAKRTRDRKKKLLEDSETIISRMERESHLLRGYCVSLNMISMEDATRCEERASESKRELAALKVRLTTITRNISDIAYRFCCIFCYLIRTHDDRAQPSTQQS